MMKLYVWENALCDYSCGMIICIAENLDDARNAWRKEFKKWMKTDCFGPYETEIMNDPIVYDLEIPCDAICHFVTGGG